MGFLSDVVADVRLELAAKPLDVECLRAEAGARPEPLEWVAGLRAASPALIAEVKRRSPSAGPIAPAGAADQARAYARGGAAAVSVLTEPLHFGGSLDDLRAVRDAVRIPVLRKDFLVHPDQVLEARAGGADAVLVIAAAVDDDELQALLDAARRLGIGALLETHSDEELDRAIATEARVIGVNARDLETLEVDVDAALGRLGRVPRDRVAVLESGVASREDVLAAVSAGASAILVGEALMRSADPAAAIDELLGTSVSGVSPRLSRTVANGDRR
jgi:indole-3-glycerol phosphate synthase